MRLVREKIDSKRAYPITEAVELLGEVANAKFKESIDVSINLGVDPRKSDQVVRGATTLPHGTGKEVRVAVFAQGENAEKATQAGADLVGLEDLAEQVKGGELNFDVAIAAPDAMRVVGQLGRILGPRGLMPNPRTGTVTADVETAVRNAKAGTGPVSHGSGRDHSWLRRQGGFQRATDQGERGSAALRSAKGQTGFGEGAIPEESDTVHDDGSRYRH